jgi:hypothetical protein
MRIRNIGYYSELAKKLYELAVRYDTYINQDPPDTSHAEAIFSQIDTLTNQHFHLFSALHQGMTALARLAQEGRHKTAVYLCEQFCRGNENEVTKGRAMANHPRIELPLFGDESILFGYAQAGRKELVDQLLEDKFHGAPELMEHIRLPAIAGYARGLHFDLLETQLGQCLRLRSQAIQLAIQNFAALGLLAAPRIAVHLLTYLTDKELARETALMAEAHLQINQEGMRDEFSASSLLYRAFRIKRRMMEQHVSFREAYEQVKPRSFSTLLFLREEAGTDLPSPPAIDTTIPYRGKKSNYL